MVSRSLEVPDSNPDVLHMLRFSCKSEGYRQIPLGFNNLLKLKWFVYCWKCFPFEIYFALCNTAVLIENVTHTAQNSRFSYHFFILPSFVL